MSSQRSWRGRGGNLLQREIKGRALIDGRLSPDAAAVALDDPLHDGQPDAGAFIVLGAVQPLKHTEEFVRIPHVEARAVVAHEKRFDVALLQTSDFQLRLRSLAGIFER